MLDWLKRKPAATPGEQALENERQKPAGDQRLERMLGRLGSDAPVRGEAEPLVSGKPPQSIEDLAPAAPVAEPQSEIEQRPNIDDAPAAEAPPEVGSPHTTGGSTDGGFILRRDESTPAASPTAAELLAKGYSFGTGPDDRMVIFDAEGRLTDIAISTPSSDGSAAGKAAPAAPVEVEPLPSTDSTATIASAPAAETLDDTAQPPKTRKRTTRPPGAEAASEAAPPPSDDKTAPDEPVAEALDDLAQPRETRKKTARQPTAEALRETAPPPPTGGKAAGPAVGGLPQMQVIAVASQKGGSGKTTIAAHLAVRADAVGQGPVVLIDTDPQGSLAEWWRARSEDTPHLASVRPEALAANLAELRSYGTALAVIDTPPALTGSIEQVIAMADLILIPVRPSPHDLRAAGGTVELARKAGKPFMFIVNSASPRASITAQAVAALSEHGRVAPVILYQRTEFAASMIDGRTVMETAGSGRSAQEIAELWDCVYAQIGLRVAA